MQTFHLEFSKLIGYIFHIKLETSVESSVLLTPCPEGIFIQIGSKVYKIDLPTPIKSLQEAFHSQTDDWVYIKVPASETLSHSLRFKKENWDTISHIHCKKCNFPLCLNLKSSFPMPSTNWETLSELWNCHPSHEQIYSLALKPGNCYTSLFYIHLNIEDVEKNVQVQEGKVLCGNCKYEIGLRKEEFMLFRHRVYGNCEEGFGFLVEEALCERINEASRDVMIGYLRLRLMKWENLLYWKGKFRKCMNVLYKKEVVKGFDLPEDDVFQLRQLLKKFNERLPPHARKIGDWKISYVLFEDD